MRDFLANSRIWGRVSVLLIMVLSISVCLQGCSQDAESLEILSQKPVQKERMQITVLVKHAFSIDAFEEAVEEEFPDIDIVQVGNYTTALCPDEYVSRMEHDDLTDIVMTWPLSFGESYCEERLVDFSAFPFTTRYNVSMLDTLSNDGKLYYLPGPAQIRGIVYNKTLFQENGWEVPSDFDGFVKLCQTIEESGIRSIQLGFENPEVLDTAFVGYSYADSFATPKDRQWIDSYSQGKEPFLNHFEGALDTFQLMIDKGIWQKGDLEIDYSEREELFFGRKSAMIEDSVLLIRTGKEMTNSTDEFALMPFFNPGAEGNDWARLYMVCYIGMNKHLTEPANKEKYEKVLQLMDYISTPQGQASLAGDTGAMYSSLKNVEPINTLETEDVLNALEHGRYAIFSEFPNLNDTLREGLAGMVAGELSKEDVGRMMDEANANINAAKKRVDPQVLGTAEKDFTLVEMGNLITDIMRESSGCEIALFLDGGKDGYYNGKGVTAKFYEGDIIQSDIKRVMPDFKYGETGELWKVTMTGESLLKTLEYSVTVDNVSGWFYYFSGLKMCIDPTAEPGSRIKEITMTDGSEVIMDKEYTVAVTEKSVPEEYLLSCEKTGRTVSNILADSIKDKKVISPANDGRFTLPQ